MMILLDLSILLLQIHEHVKANTLHFIKNNLILAVTIEILDVKLSEKIDYCIFIMFETDIYQVYTCQVNRQTIFFNISDIVNIRNCFNMRKILCVLVPWNCQDNAN